MNLAVVGVGGAGCRLLDRLVEIESASGLDIGDANAMAIDTDRTALDDVTGVAPAARVPIGDPVEMGDDEAHDPDRGVAAARTSRGELVDAFGRLDLPRIDAVLVVAGVGGATGGGAGAVVLEQLTSVTDRPVYAVAVLPAEGEGRDAARTAVRSLRSFVDGGDSVIAFDNEAWCPDAHEPDGDYVEANRALAIRLVTLFGAGEPTAEDVIEGRIDPSDLVRTLEPGGLASIGYAAMDVSGRDGGSRLGLRSMLRRDDGGEDDPDGEAIAYLARRAARGKLTLPCDLASAERALVLRSGPSAALAGVGFEDGRFWLEETADTVEVLAGSVPNETATELATVVLLANVTVVPGLEALKARARDA